LLLIHGSKAFGVVLVLLDESILICVDFSGLELTKDTLEKVFKAVHLGVDFGELLGMASVFRLVGEITENLEE